MLASDISSLPATEFLPCSPLSSSHLSSRRLLCGVGSMANSVISSKFRSPFFSHLYSFRRPPWSAQCWYHRLCLERCPFVAYVKSPALSERYAPPYSLKRYCFLYLIYRHLAATPILGNLSTLSSRKLENPPFRATIYPLCDLVNFFTKTSPYRPER